MLQEYLSCFRVFYVVLLAFLVLASLVNAVDKPKDEAFIKIIKDFLTGSAASGSDFTGYQFYGWMSQMSNVKFTNAEIIKTGELQDKMGTKYWPVRARFAGTFDGTAPLSKPQRKKFDTTANFMVLINDFGELKVEFMMDDPIVGHGNTGAQGQDNNITTDNDAEAVKKDASQPAIKRSPLERHNYLASKFLVNSEFKGETTHAASKYPFVLQVKTMDTATGNWTGELKWTSLNSIHKVEGTMKDTQITFKGVEYIKKGKIMLDSFYTVELDDSEKKLTGTWEWKMNNKGNVWILLE